MFAVYFNDVEKYHPEDRIVCDTLDVAKKAVDEAVLSGFEKAGVLHAWKGTVYPLGNDPQEGSPFNASDLSQCVYQQIST